LDSLEKSLADRYTELSNACVEFFFRKEHYCLMKKGSENIRRYYCPAKSGRCKNHR
jgi:hypothetical protein